MSSTQTIAIQVGWRRVFSQTARCREKCRIAAIPAIAATRIERGGDAKSSILRPIGPGGSAEESNMRAAYITRYGDNSVVGVGRCRSHSRRGRGTNRGAGGGDQPGRNLDEGWALQSYASLQFPQVMGYDIAGLVASAPRAPRSRQAMRSTLGYPTPACAYAERAVFRWPPGPQTSVSFL